MYEYDYGYTNPGVGDLSNFMGVMAAVSGVITIISLIVSILLIVSQWKIYKKAGKKGWECLIPIYNIIVLLQIVELPMWYIALFFVPFANIYAMFKIYIELAHKFGKSTGFGVLTVFFNIICFPILAFSKTCVYQGSNNNQNVNNVDNQQTVQPTPNVTNNTENQLNNNQQPIMFNQNVNTEINPINSLGFEPIDQTNNQTQNNISNLPINLQENPLKNQMPNNPQSELNVIPSMSNPQVEQSQPVETPNIVSIPQPAEPINSSNANQPITFNQETKVNNEASQINVIPNLSNNEPQLNNVNTNPILQPQSNPQSELNVIPSATNQQIEQPQPVSPQNIVNIPQMNMNQPVPVGGQTTTNNNQPITFNQEPQTNNGMPEINVIPTLGPTPTIQNTDNNQNM